MRSDRGKRKRTRLGRVKRKHQRFLLSDWYLSSLAAVSFGSPRCLPAPDCVPAEAVGKVWASVPTLRLCTGSERDQTSVCGSSAHHTSVALQLSNFQQAFRKDGRTFWRSEPRWAQDGSGCFVLFVPWKRRLYPPQCRAVPTWTSAQPLAKQLHGKMNFALEKKRWRSWPLVD